LGEVTLRLSSAGVSCEAIASAPAPATVARASRNARSAGNPSASPAAASVSIRWNA
jgi:hypothetical protein